MKYSQRYTKLILIFIAFAGISLSGFCDSLDFRGSCVKKLNLQDPCSVSDKANRTSPYGSSYDLDGFLNPATDSALSGFTNMMQGVANNPYSVQEQQKQQTEYAKQQMEYAKQMDAESGKSEE
ncbi:MAG: hypothetical protein WCY19_02340 [Candidatus Gastranaerophilaceae bacterium]